MESPLSQAGRELKFFGKLFLGILLILLEPFLCLKNRLQKTNYLRPTFLRPTAPYRIGRKQIGRENIRDAADHIKSRLLCLKGIRNGLHGCGNLSGAQGREGRSGSADVE